VGIGSRMSPVRSPRIVWGQAALGHRVINHRRDRIFRRTKGWYRRAIRDAERTRCIDRSLCNGATQRENETSGITSTPGKRGGCGKYGRSYKSSSSHTGVFVLLNKLCTDSRTKNPLWSQAMSCALPSMVLLPRSCATTGCSFSSLRLDLRLQYRV
jgi:hypothetical protein